MCKCTPNIKTPWCGKIGCEQPVQKTEKVIPNVIDEIRFPNTVKEEEQGVYNSEDFFIERITKNGEMAPINWMKISLKTTRNGKPFYKHCADIIESVCDIFYRPATEEEIKNLPNFPF